MQCRQGGPVMALSRLASFLLWRLPRCAQGGRQAVSYLCCYVEVEFLSHRVLFGREACRSRLLLELVGAAPAAAEPVAARDAVAPDAATTCAASSNIAPPPAPGPTSAASEVAGTSAPTLAPAAGPAASPV